MPALKEREWRGWFRPISRPIRLGPLILSEIKDQRIKTSDKHTLVISVPRACGNAVLRNRFRRVVKACVEKEWTNKDIWLRLQKNFKLEQKITTSDWKDPIQRVLHQIR